MDRAPGNAPFGFFLAIGWILALYTFIPSVVAGAPIPAPLFYVFGLSLFALNHNCLTNGNVQACVLIFGVFILSMILSFSPFAGFEGRIVILSMHMVCLVSGLGFALEVGQWNEKIRHRFIRTLMWVFFIGVLLEATTPFSQISDAWRVLIYSSERLYVGDVRDITTMGGIRPKFFGNEPSYLAVMCATLAYLSFIMSKTRAERLRTGTAAIGFILLIRSPISVSVLLLIPFYYLFRNGVSLKRVLALSLAALPLLAVVVTLSDAMGGILAAVFPRAGLMAAGQDNSLGARFLHPAELLVQVLLNYPLFGVGLGGKELAAPLAMNTATYALLPEIQVNLENGITGGAAIFAIPINLGIVGSFLFWRVCHLMAQTLTWARWGVILIPCLVVGAFVSFSVQFWGYLFMFIMFTPQMAKLAASLPLEPVSEPVPTESAQAG